jgi:DNA-binding transcriptional regulator YhcF (GntR family)
MEFEENKPIYLQIGDYMSERIVTGEWKVEERVPSIRELAVEMEVNPNTVVRTYNHLQDLGIIYNKRGIGYFVSPDGAKLVQKEQREQFFREELPKLFHRMHTLGIELDEVIHRYRESGEEMR